MAWQPDVSSTMRATMTLTAVLGLNQNVWPGRRMTRMPWAVSSDNRWTRCRGSASQGCRLTALWAGWQ